MAGGKDGVDLRVEARIARSHRCRVLHSWALLRQVGGLRDVAKLGSADKLSSNAEPRLLNSRAMAGKCQTICDGGVHARVRRPSAGGFCGEERLAGRDLSLGHGTRDACECPSYGLECGRFFADAEFTGTSEGVDQRPCGFSPDGAFFFLFLTEWRC